MKAIVKIGRKKVGDGNPCFIIAEAASNHNRNMKVAKRLVDAAVEAGVDAVKFQTFSAATLITKRLEPYNIDPKVFDMFVKAELPRQWQGELLDYCKSQGIIFLSTPFDHKAIDELAALKVAAFKIASPEIVDLDLLRHAASKHRPMLISTALANLGDIELALETVRKQRNDDIVLLHCNALYPTPPRVVNLKAIDTMKKAFGIPVGFSDHTVGTMIPIVAAARGANVIEKHFTLDRKMKGPDHGFSVEPDELKTIVEGIRHIECALGTGIKDRHPDEDSMYPRARRALYARVRIPKGTRITEDMIISKRPGFGIPPRFKNIVLRGKAKRDIEEDEALNWNMI
jgi:N-acetylneuraminate synthase/N,N'-diacetyllegionaminate synthase